MPPAFPKKFGKYLLMRKIATGGMAEIFQAKTAGAEGFEKDIVIKRILPHFSEDDAFVKMFIDEASITAKLQHSNIVQIFDFDVIEGSYYIAMEYIEGVDLAAVMADGQAANSHISVPQCVWVTIELAKGLHYAHIKEHKGRPLNIIHRDISPHNAMIAFNGEVKLMDFGIAKAAERSSKTMAGTVKGKVAYMSPEQARGKPLDGRSDLFALATVLWEMLTHQRLYLRNSDFETLTAVLKEDPEPPSRYRPEVGQELDDIILTALEKDPAHRQKTVEDFSRELTRWYYKNVQDLEREKLRPTMQSLYRSTISKLHAVRTNPGQMEQHRASQNNGGNRRAAIPPARKQGLERQDRGDADRRAGQQTPNRRHKLPEPPTDRAAMTVEASLEDVLSQASPRLAKRVSDRPKTGGEYVAAPPPKSGKAAKKPAADQFFSASQTMNEDSAPSQEELFAALQADRARRRGDAPQAPAPDMTLDGRRLPNGKGKSRKAEQSHPTEKSMTPLVLVLAVIFLALGGLIAFLVAP